MQFDVAFCFTFNSILLSVSLQYEDELEAAGITNSSNDHTEMPGTFGSFPPPPPPPSQSANGDEDEITDDVVLKTFGVNEISMLPTEEKDKDLETEI